jgi:hypothetical protein
MPSCSLGDPAQWETGALIEGISGLNAAARLGALAVFAHQMTVEIRILLSEGLPDQLTVDRVRAINEFQHQLTSRLHPDESRAPEQDKSMLRDIAADAARCGLTSAIKRGLIIAARNAFASATSVAAG